MTPNIWPTLASVDFPEEVARQILQESQWQHFVVQQNAWPISAGCPGKQMIALGLVHCGLIHVGDEFRGMASGGVSVESCEVGVLLTLHKHRKN